MSNLCFSDQMSEDERQRSLGLLTRFNDACERRGVDYSLCFGTALGLERHGGFIPWDDDMDVCVPARDEPALREVLRDINGDEVQHVWHSTEQFDGIDNFYKMYYVDGQQIEDTEFTWPFLDVFVIPEDSQYYTVLFPSEAADRFEGVSGLRRPRDPGAHLSEEYGSDFMEVAHDSGFCHRLETVVRECEPRSLRPPG